MTIDVERVRADTPGTEHVIHFNNAGASLPPQCVIDAVIAHVLLEARIGGYEAAAEASAAIDAVYDDIAALIGAQRDEIAQVDSATAAWNAAFTSIELRPGDRILTGRSEYPSNAVNMLLATQRHGAEIVLIDDDEHGQISLDDLRREIDERTQLIALTHVATSGGLVNPAAAVGRIANDAGVRYLLDACQSIGQLPLDVDEIGCDLLSAAGRKFLRGPRGTGFLYVREGVLDSLRPYVLDTRSATWTGPDSYEVSAGARRFESWESSYANRLGLGAAIRYALDVGIDAIAARTSALAETLREQLATLPRVTVHDKGLQRCSLVTFDVGGHDPSDVQSALSALSINTTITEAISAQYDFPHRGIDSLVRASPHYFNTEDEVGVLVAAVADLL
ncbi:MAG: aminotransferase class V-fold PLP-dependent enzyme [Ilumatobacteraceae bacterium]